MPALTATLTGHALDGELEQVVPFTRLIPIDAVIPAQGDVLTIVTGDGAVEVRVLGRILRLSAAGALLELDLHVATTPRARRAHGGDRAALEAAGFTNTPQTAAAASPGA